MRLIGTAIFALMLCALTAFAAPVTVVHQGQLLSSGVPVDGAVDMRFTLFDAAVGGAAVGGTVEVLAVPVVGGLYTAEVVLDSGLFTGVPLWFEIEAATGGTGSWFTLSPRQRVGVTPEAAHAVEADRAVTADYALAGPFAPADPTPKDTSGAPPGSEYLVEVSIAGSRVERVTLAGPVVMQRFYTFVPEMPGNVPAILGVSPDYDGVRITLRRNYSASAGQDWYSEFLSISNVGSVEVNIFASHTGYGITAWTFTGGLVVDYEIVPGSSGGAYEQIIVVFGGVNAVRSFTPSAPQTEGLRAPTIGRLTVPGGGPMGGRMTLSVNGVPEDFSVFDLAVGGSFQHNSRDQSTGGGFIPAGAKYTFAPDGKLTTLRRCVLGDNSLFDAYTALNQGMNFEVPLLNFEVGTAIGSGVTPIFTMQGNVIGITLREAGDGMLVEEYSLITFQPQRVP